MNSSDQDLWNRVRERLKSNVGDDIFNSWFARMELEAIEGDTVRHSVPTRFLKSWVQSHYADRLLACWQEELSTITRLELTVRSAVLKPLPQSGTAPRLQSSAGVISNLISGAHGRAVMNPTVQRYLTGPLTV